MRKTQRLYLLFFVALGASLWIASSTGRDDDRSGAPPSNASCNECHNNGGGGGNISITGQPDGPYVNGQAYNITLTTFDANAVVGGFQIVARTPANQNIGTWTSGTGNRNSGNGGITHSTPRSFNASDEVSWNFTWTAPATGSTPVYFYFSGVAANGNGNNGSGDDVYLGSILGCTTPVSISGDANVCNGSSITLTASGADTYVWQPGNLTGPSITVSPTNTTTYTVVGTVTATGCTGTDTHQVTVRPRPNVSIAPTHVSCFGLNDGSATATGSNGQAPYTYDWSTGASGQTVNNLAPGTYTVTVTDNFGCTRTNTTTITQPPVLVASFTGVTEVCPNETTTLQVNATGGTPPYAGTGPRVLTQGTYELIVADNHGCTDGVSVTIEETPGPDPLITGNLNFCQGSNTTLNAGAGYSGYQWSTGALSQTIVVSTAGTYSVTVSDANGCTGVSSVVVTSAPAPNASINGPNAVCEGGTIILSTTPGLQGYLWNTGATTSSIDVSAAGTYSVTVTGSGNCTATSSKVVSQATAPSVDITGSLTFCPGSSVTLDAGGGFAEYSWTGPGGFTATTQTIQVTVAGTYTVEVTNSANCSGSDAVTVTENSSLQPQISAPAGICPGGEATLNAGSGFSSYTWSTGASSQSITVGQAGSYAVTVSNGSGCSGSDTVTLSNLSNPTVHIFGDTILCGTDSVHLSAITDAQQFAWSTGETTQTIIVEQEGANMVTVTDANGCQASDSVFVHQSPTLTFTLQGPSSFCSGGSVLLDAGTGFESYLWNTGATTPSILVTEGGTYSVTLTPAEGCPSFGTKTITEADSLQPVISGIPGFCPGGSTALSVGSGYASYNWSNGDLTDTTIVSTAGTISITVTDQSGCSGSASEEILAFPDPVFVMTPVPDLSCHGDSAQVDILGWVGVAWSDGLEGPVNWLGEGDYSVTVTDINGCTADADFQIQAPDSLYVNGEIDENDITLTTEGGIAPYSYLWSDGSDLKDRVDLPAGNYTVTVTDVNDCSAGASFSISQVGVHELEPGHYLMSPNPVRDEALLSGNILAAGTRISVCFSSGQIAKQYTLRQSSDTFILPMGDLPAGLYFVQVRHSGGTWNQGLVKN